MENLFLICVEFRKGGDCLVYYFFRGRGFFETEVVEGDFKIEFVSCIIFGDMGLDCSFQKVADWFVGLFCGRLNRGTLSFGCAGGGLLTHFGFNIRDGNNTISKDIELFLESGIDDVTEFLGSFGNNSFKEGEEATGDLKFCGAEGSFGGFFVRDCEDRDWSATFGLLDIVFFADVVIEVQ